jgi:hypothetical protein
MFPFQSARPRALFPLLAGIALLTTPPLLAQGTPFQPPSGRLVGGGALQVTNPRGAFGENVGTGFGAGGHLIWRLDPSALLNLRTEVGLLTYGTTNRRIPMANTGGLIQLRLRTSNNIASVVAGPQLIGAVGRFTPYFSALGGFSVFWTESTVEGSQNANTPFASTTNSADAVLAYGGSGGAYWRIAQGSRPVRLDFNVRYLRHDDVRYLTDDRVTAAFRSNAEPVPVRGRADMVTYSLGVTAHLF